MASVKSCQVGSKLSVNFMTNMQKLHRGIWPWTKGLKSRLPLHYKIRYTETWMKTSQPVHYREESRKFLPDEFNQPVRVQNIPIPITFPLEADHGLWGGEGIVAGLKKKKNNMYKPRTPTIWKPFLTSRVLYSEILDKYFDITVTLRTLNLIDECYGFDFYILKTHEVDLKSKLGMTLKRTMLIALSKKSFYPDNPKKQREIYEKYKEYEIPLEEAEWVGLSLQEAERKQHEIEEKSALQNEKPLKHYYADNLLKEIKESAPTDSEESKSKSWFRNFLNISEKK